MMRKRPLRLLVFTDLDGTLLDHETYDFTPARPMLDRLARAAVPVVLASSKTAAEVSLWQRRLGLTRWPAIVENGAALFEGREADGAYRRLRRVLAGIGAPFRGFGDMEAEEVAAVTGLSPEEARLAKRRGYSEPGLWQGNAADLPAFLASLKERGIEARQGGRFLTLSFGGTKADRMRELIARFRPEATVALGDAPNDAEMLALADFGVVVRNPHGPGLPPFPAEKERRIYRTRATGPAGWAEGMEFVLASLGRPDAAEGERDG